MSWPQVQPLIEQAPSAGRLRAALSRARRSAYPPGVYIFAYHSIFDPESAEPWETHYRKVLTKREDFEAHLRYLAEHMSPVELERVPELFTGRAVDRPYYALTFDDAYVSVARSGLAVEARGLRPTVFVSSRFSGGETVYYRVLVSLLLAAGHADRLAEALSDEVGAPFDAADLMSQTKDRYVPGRTEAAVERVWGELGVEQPRAHLTYDELAGLRERGWSIGNHTRSHPTLARLAPDALDAEILGNQSDLAAAGLEPIPWLAYPNGTAAHVSPEVGAWMASHPELHGAHANGGVNLEPSRSEWLRIAVGDESLPVFRARLRHAVQATLWMRNRR